MTAMRKYGKNFILICGRCYFSFFDTIFHIDIFDDLKLRTSSTHVTIISDQEVAEVT